MKKLLKITFLSGGLTLVKMVIGFVIAKITAIYLGPTGMTMLGQVQSLVTACNGIINAPVNNGVIKYTAQHENKADYQVHAAWWRAAVYWTFILLAIMLPVGYFLAPYLAEKIFHDSSLKWVIYSSILSLPLTAMGTLIASVINGLQSYKRYVITGMIASVISGAVIIVFLMQAGIDGGLLALTLQYALIGIITLLLNIGQPWLRLKYFFGKADNKAKKDILSYVLMAATTSLTLPVALIFTRNILIHFTGWNETGEWQAVWKISEVYLSVITMALGAYYLPKLSGLKTLDAIKKEINTTAVIVIPLVSLLAVLVYLLRDVAITILFTEAFRGARELFAIQLLGDVVKIASWLYAYPMLSNKATRWFIFSEIAFSVTWVLITYVMVSWLGVHGANIAYLVNYSLYFVFVFLNLKRFAR